MIDSPALAEEIARIERESDLRVLAIYRNRLLRDANGPPVPKALWRRLAKGRP